MLWQVLTFISILAAAGLQLWWRARLRQAKADSQRALEKLQYAQAQTSQQIQTQQEALFDSMAEACYCSMTGRGFNWQTAPSTNFSGSRRISGAKPSWKRCG